MQILNRSQEEDNEIFSSLNNTRESINLVSKKDDSHNRTITPIDEKYHIQKDKLKKTVKNSNRFMLNSPSKNSSIESPVYKHKRFDILK
jgi:hypothetical protein